MQVIEGYSCVPASVRGASVAIGNFDGVHRGHQVLLEEARALARPLGVVTFEPHPRRLFQPDAPSFRLTTPDEKARVLSGLGVDVLFNLPFDRALAGMAAEDFVKEVLHAGLGLSHIVCGADFRFGKARAGDATLLRKMGMELGFSVNIQELVGDETGEFASTALRVLIQEGRCDEAARQLGRWHTVSGPVIKGDQRGRDLGYPTANLAFGVQLVPRYGVYAAWADVLEGAHAGRHAGVVSIGERPTFGVNAPNFEVHLFDFEGDLYGTQISVGLVRYLRDEIAFSGVDALIEQMDQDSADARAVLQDASIMS